MLQPNPDRQPPFFQSSIIEIAFGKEDHVMRRVLGVTAILVLVGVALAGAVGEGCGSGCKDCVDRWFGQQCALVDGQAGSCKCTNYGADVTGGPEICITSGDACYGIIVTP